MKKPLSEFVRYFRRENGAPKKPERRFKTSTGNNIGYFSRIEENGWGWMLSIDENEIMAPLREMILWNAPRSNGDHRGLDDLHPPVLLFSDLS